jgi:hypothetical protein
MPNMTNITVKKADGTTDITYTGVSPSAGFGSSALFRSNSVGTSVAARPSLAVTPVQRANRLVAKVNFVYPIVDSATGKVVDYGTIKGESNFPMAASDTDVSEGVSQGTNLIATTLIKSVMKEGNGPN